MRNPRLLAAGAALAALSLAACGSSGSKVDAGQPAAVSTTAATANGGGAAAGCAKDDGSSPKTTKFAAYPPMCIKDGVAYTAVVETTQGTLHIKLRNDIAPKTVNSFVNLARFHYFDATTCHRAIKGFVVQCGDPTATGTGGPGYEFEDELSKIEPYQVGSVAMANAGPNTNGSQFFIITGQSGVQLPPQYNHFGQVVKGLEIVDAMQRVATDRNDRPLEDVVINSVTITVAD